MTTTKIAAWRILVVLLVVLGLQEVYVGLTAPGASVYGLVDFVLGVLLLWGARGSHRKAKALEAKRAAVGRNAWPAPDNEEGVT